MKRLLTFVIAATSIFAEPPQTGIAQSGITYKVTPYSGGFFPGYSFISVQTTNPQTSAVRVTVNFVDGAGYGQIATIQSYTGPLNSCPELEGHSGACVLIVGDWEKVVGMKIEELQVAAVHQVQ